MIDICNLVVRSNLINGLDVWLNSKVVYTSDSRKCSTV